ncbi:hypothetical protein BC826DRAFT_441125 [Russula brevipes]|nr:hypothetical protein BC826DRAFT_441125 [Russula brevipes]
MPTSHPSIKATFAFILIIITHPVWSLPIGFVPKDRKSRTFSPFRIDKKLIFDLKFVLAFFVMLSVLYVWVTRRMVVVRFVARIHCAWPVLAFSAPFLKIRRAGALTMPISAVQQIFYFPFTVLDVASTTIFGTGDARPPRPARPMGGPAYPVASARSSRRHERSQSGRASAT